MKSLLKLSLTVFCLLLSIRVLVAQEPGTSAGGGSPVPGIIGLFIALLVIVATWKVAAPLNPGPAQQRKHAHPA